jgi:hypothetical protein
LSGVLKLKGTPVIALLDDILTVTVIMNLITLFIKGERRSTKHHIDYLRKYNHGVFDTISAFSSVKLRVLSGKIS